LYTLYKPAKLILINVKTTITHLARKRQLTGIKENYCESGAKYDTSAPSCLVLATLRGKPKIQKEI
jgi:hypothetical protein